MKYQCRFLNCNKYTTLIHYVIMENCVHVPLFEEAGHIWELSVLCVDLM